MPGKPSGDGVFARAADSRGDQAARDATALAPADDAAAKTGDDQPVPSGEAVEAPATTSRSSVRWWLGVAVGIVVFMPIAWLLSYAAALPFYLGVFFFLLFGLVIGAIVHRVAAPGRPFGRAVLVIGTALIVLTGWLASLVKESRDFPYDMAAKAAHTRYIGPQAVSEYRSAVAEDVRQFLRERYAPGGLIGYTRWVLASGQVRRGEIESVKVTLRRSQRGYKWGIRVLGSVLLLAFGIGSQTLGLRRAADTAVRVIDQQSGI